jgi:hypothetical protein
VTQQLEKQEKKRENSNSLSNIDSAHMHTHIQVPCQKTEISAIGFCSHSFLRQADAKNSRELFSIKEILRSKKKKENRKTPKTGKGTQRAQLVVVATPPGK